MVLRAVGYPKPLTVSGYKSDYFGKDPEFFFNRADKEEVAKNFGVDDFGAGFIRLEGGIILDFRISWAMHMDTPGDTIILGTKGGLRIPSTDCWNGSIGGPMTIYKTVAGKTMEMKVPMSVAKPSDVTLWDWLWIKKIATFFDACRNGTEAPVPIDQIIYNQAIICGIVESAKRGEEIKLDFSEIENL
jgi:predicted dehydrogenase